jgi:hypothetical protein
MDDQSADREGRSVVTKSRYRLQVGLRLMLLLVALFCVLTAYFRAYSDLRRETIKGELISLEHEQLYWSNVIKYNGAVGPKPAAKLAALNAEIAKKKRAIGENN